MKPRILLLLDALTLFARCVLVAIDISTVPQPEDPRENYDPVKMCIIGSGAILGVSFILKILAIDLPFSCKKTLN